MEHQLLEGFLNNQAPEIDAQRAQLIRVLSRSGTLPKVADLQVQYIHSQPEMFVMIPGKQLRIGIRLLQQPVLALVALRYGIEWHMWYKAVQGADGDVRVADLAAARVAVKFMELLPDDDRTELFKNFPDDLKELFAVVSKSTFKLEEFEQTDIQVIAKFHKLEAPQRPINPDWLRIIDYLAVPTEALLMSGGDLRLNIETRYLLNVYGCRPFPRPEAFSFASSTATSVSNIAFDLTQKQREQIISASFLHGLQRAFKQQQRDLFARLRKALHLGSTTALLTSPSGTDISLLFAGMCQALYQNPITHILVASDETGSGVPMALAGCHFADTSALNQPVKKEAAIAGFVPVEVVKIPLRDAAGHLKLRATLDAEVDNAIKNAMANGSKPVLHVMDQSKLGYAAPSQEYLTRIPEQFGNHVVVLVDNSQLRMDVSRIENYLNLGFLMTITGSKYYTGPPFSGALVMPKWFADAVANSKNPLPIGLGNYFLKSEFVNDVPMAATLADGYNYGSYLRWHAALVEMERYFAIPSTLRSMGRELFCEHVASRIRNSPFMEALEQSPNPKAPYAEEPRTIFPFFILKEGRVLSQPQADRVYRLLNMDISKMAPFASDVEQRIAAQACHIGQPVKVFYRDSEPSAVVRISLGSRIISESWVDKDVSLFFHRIESQMHQVDLVCSKIELILKYASELEVA
jgi:hypothetical protein